MKNLIVMAIFVSNPVWSIEPCSEHGYCTELGIPHIRHIPQFSEKQKSICAGAQFEISFELNSGMPINVSVTEGPTEFSIRHTIKESFEKWRYSGAISISSAKEMLVLGPSCELKEHEGIIKIMESEREQN